MKFLLLVAAVCVLSQSVLAASAKAKPFSNLKRYSVAGTLSLPYAEINEPFRAWYDSDQSASRIDYYDGMEKTIQWAPSASSQYGWSIKVTPMTDETQTNVKTCFWVNGTDAAPIALQSVIPDTTDFDFIGEASWKSFTVDQWQLITTEGDKKNTYTLYVDQKTGNPVYYEMIGYDSLLGSHYDRYYVEYFNFDTSEVEPSLFTIPTGLTCRDFPGPGDAGRKRALANPMREFIHNDESHIHGAFDDFKDKHGKTYPTNMEHKERLHIFRQNFRYVHSVNRRGLSYRVAVNHLADKSSEEIKVLSGKLRSSPTSTPNNGQAFDMSKYTKKQRALPDSFDWRIFGAVSPVKDQGVCGSCWSFGSSESIEGAYFVKHNKLVRLSAQNLVDCSWGFGNNGCDGGEDFRAYDWIIKHGGIATEESYGQYLQADGYCHFGDATVGAQLTGYVNITSYDPVALKTALVNEGPISIAIDASHKSMVFYSHGLYYEPECGNKPESLDHAVLLVGYGTIDGQDYWLVKNSWSNYWGNDGYILMSQKDNNCGVTTQTTYPIVV